MEGTSGGGAVTISAEFLQNIQTSMDSSGVIGQVQVIETDEGPMTVIFMEEGADASALNTNQIFTDAGLTIGDGSHIQYAVTETGDASNSQIQYVDVDGNPVDPLQYGLETGDGTQVQYHFIQSSEDYTGLLGNMAADAVGIVPTEASLTSQDGNAVAVDPVIDLAAEQPITNQQIADHLIAHQQVPGQQSEHQQDSSQQNAYEQVLNQLDTFQQAPVLQADFHQISSQPAAGQSVADNIETLLQAAHDSGETLYITESGEIIKIDTSLLAGTQFSTSDGSMLYETNARNSSADEQFVATKFLTDQLGNENVFSVVQPHASSVQFSAVPSVSTPRIVTKPQAKTTQNKSPYTHKVISSSSPTVGRSLLPPNTAASFNLKSINNTQSTNKKQSLLLPHLANQKPQVLTFKSNENTYIIKSFDSESAASASVWNQTKPNVSSVAVAKPQMAPQMLAMKKQLQPFEKQLVTSHPVIGQTKRNAAELDKGTMTLVSPMPKVQTISTMMKSQGTPTSLLNTNRMMEYKISRSGVTPAAIKKPLQTVAKQPIITAGVKQTVSTPFTTVKNIVTGKPTTFMPKVSRPLTADLQANTTDVKQYGAPYKTPLKIIADVKQQTPTFSVRVPDSHTQMGAGKAEYTEADKGNATQEKKQIVTGNGNLSENACVNGDEGNKSHNQTIIYSNPHDYKHVVDKIATATDVLSSSNASSVAAPLYEVLADKDNEAEINASNLLAEAKSPKLVTDSGEVRRIVPFKADTSTEVTNSRQYEDEVPIMLEMYKPIFNAYQCGICSEEFTMELNFKKHHLEKHTEKLTCLACNQNFRSDHILNNHMTLMHTVGKPLVCPLCSLGFLKPNLYWAHAARHASLFKCNICLQVFNCNLELQRHMVDVHVEKNSKCVQCGQVFSSVSEVNEHKRVQHGEDKQQSQADLTDTKLLEQNAEGPGQDFLEEEQLSGDSMSNQSPLAFYIDSHGQLTPQQNVQPAKAVDKTPVAECTTEQKQEVVPATVLERPSATAGQPEITVCSQSECLDKNESSILESKQSSDDGENKQPVVPSPKMKSIDVPDSDVTIQLYADGTLVTSDKSGTNYSKVRLEDLGLDHTMLQGNTNIELLIVQGDGKEVRAIINTNMQSDVQKSDSEKENPEFGKDSQDNKKSREQPVFDEEDGELRATADDPRPYKCSMCPRTFKFYRTFKCHEVVHTKAETYTCPLCKRLFARENNLRSHLQLHEKKAAMQKATSKESQTRDDKMWHCEHCRQSFTAHTNLLRHVRQQHENKTGVLCAICDKRFLNEANVQRHLKTHVGPFPCIYCESKFDVHDELANHMKEQHNDKLFMCKCCDKMLLSKKSLITHISEHHGNTSAGKEQMEDLKKYECEECGSKFTKMAVLAKHKFIHIKVDEFKCNECPKTFTVEWKLTKHQKTHESPTIHKCPDCDEGFKFPHFLENHKMSYHQGSYPCCECKEEFASRLHLEDHQYEKHESGFSCAKCEKKLKNSLELERHSNTEHMITVGSSYLCENCVESFEHKPQLKTHLLKRHYNDSKKAMLKEYPEMRTVPDELTCDICDTYCKNRAAYKQHFKDEHFEGDADAMYEVCPELRKFPDPADPVVCDHCGKSCTNLTYLNMHLKVHGIAVNNKEMTDRENSDSSSNDEGSDESDVDFTNIEPRDAEKLYECKECGGKFARQAALAKHIKSHEKDDLKEAIKNMLQEDLQRKDKLVKQTPIEGIDASARAKSLKRKSSEMHICSVCHQVFNSKDELRVHRNADVCEKADDTGAELISANKILFDAKTRECKSCHKVFANRHNLKRHLETIHKNREIDNFSESSETMTPSSTTPSAATKYSTENGGSGSNKKTFKSLSKSTDDGSLPEDGSDISSFLGKNFNLEKTPSNPCNIASVKKKCHKCTICGEGFSREATLKKHLLLHDECNDSEYDMRPERSHDLMADLQRALYPCVTCGNIYSTAGGLIYHSRGKHPEVDEAAIVTKINEITDMLNASKMGKIKGENKGNAIKKAQKRKLHESTENLDELVKKKIKLDETDSVNSGRQSLSGRTITKNSRYEEHVKCNHCFKLFDDVSNYRRHVKAVHNGEQKAVTQLSIEDDHGQKCEHCDKTFLGLINLRRHLNMKHGISFDETKPNETKETAILSAIYNCDVCEQKFSSLFNLRNHMITVHDENDEYDFNVKGETFECPVCRKEFSSKQKLDFHMRKHTEEKLYECSVCGKRCISKHKLELHLRKFHRKQWLRKIKCKICLFLFDTKHAMLKHKVTHRKLVEENDCVTTTHTNKCLKCDKVFKWKRNLVSHAKIFHKDSDPLTCGVCNKVFPDKKSIKDHLKEHQEQKWTCETCKKCFSKKLHLKEHEAVVHKSCGSLSCDICKQSFVTKQKLLEHMLSHTSMMPHKCEICSTSFKSLHLLKAHKLRHNLKEKHKQLNLKSVKSDTNEVEMKVICKKCDRKFSTEWSLKVHVAKAHVRGNEIKTCLKAKQNVTITTEAKEKISANSEVNESMLNVEAKDKIKSKDNEKATTKDEHESKPVAKKVAPSLLLNSSDVKLKSPLMKKQSLITTTKKKMPLIKSKTPVIKLKSPGLKIHTSLQKALSKQAAEIAHFASKLESDTHEAEMSITHCETCNLDFASYKLYQKHMKHTHNISESQSPLKIESDLNDSVCPLCHSVFSHRGNLKRHLEVLHNDEFVKPLNTSTKQVVQCVHCSECNKVFWYKDQFELHLNETHQNNAALQLDNKHPGVKKEVMDANHLSLKQGQPGIEETCQKCEFCSKIHWTKKAFEDHILKCHPEHAETYGLQGGLSELKPEIELVDDSEETNKYISGHLFEKMPIEKLSAYPVVMIERMPCGMALIHQVATQARKLLNNEIKDEVYTSVGKEEHDNGVEMTVKCDPDEYKFDGTITTNDDYDEHSPDLNKKTEDAAERLVIENVRHIENSDSICENEETDKFAKSFLNEEEKINVHGNNGKFKAEDEFSGKIDLLTKNDTENTDIFQTSDSVTSFQTGLIQNKPEEGMNEIGNYICDASKVEKCVLDVVHERNIFEMYGHYDFQQSKTDKYNSSEEILQNHLCDDMNTPKDSDNKYVSNTCEQSDKTVKEEVANSQRLAADLKEVNTNGDNDKQSLEINSKSKGILVDVNIELHEHISNEMTTDDADDKKHNVDSVEDIEQMDVTESDISSLQSNSNLLGATDKVSETQEEVDGNSKNFTIVAVSDIEKNYINIDGTTKNDNEEENGHLLHTDSSGFNAENKMVID